MSSPERSHENSRQKPKRSITRFIPSFSVRDLLVTALLYGAVLPWGVQQDMARHKKKIIRAAWEQLEKDVADPEGLSGMFERDYAEVLLMMNEGGSCFRNVITPEERIDLLKKRAKKAFRLAHLQDHFADLDLEDMFETLQFANDVCVDDPPITIADINVTQEQIDWVRKNEINKLMGDSTIRVQVTGGSHKVSGDDPFGES
jgi:hypothetical protein